MLHINKNSMKPLMETNNIVVIFAVLIAASLVWNTMKAIDENFALQKKVDALQEEVSLLELQNKNLALNNEYYKTNEYLELAAREKLNKVAPGESVLVLPERDREAKTGITAQQAVAKETSNFEEWMYFLFGIEP